MADFKVDLEVAQLRARRRGLLFMAIGVALMLAANYLKGPDANWIWQAVYPPFAA